MMEQDKGLKVSVSEVSISDLKPERGVNAWGADYWRLVVGGKTEVNVVEQLSGDLGDPNREFYGLNVIYAKKDAKDQWHAIVGPSLTFSDGEVKPSDAPAIATAIGVMIQLGVDPLEVQDMFGKASYRRNFRDRK